ncbi:hypothetical protein [uncultured Duncaniella sp.]|uniref:hypothetical protein n=1 Tax=uncultured Duncaniella sp. TaxID=2768039 RepID=UPI0025A9F351|nr:hypothetical protein [uncultured Duncaniella sp.]
MCNVNRIDLCRFYNGEASFPQSLEYKSPLAFLFWEAESLFINRKGTDFEQELIKQYFDSGLDYNNKTLPLPLLAALFAVFCKGSDCDLHQLAIYFEINFLPQYLNLSENE